MRSWTTAEEAFLIANAGIRPKREICRKLKRSGKSVECKARQMRLQGEAIDLRCYRPTLETCPACGRLSANLGREGICEPCRRREQLDAINARISELWPLLSQEDRDTYERTEAETDVSRRDPRPKRPDTHGMSQYHRLKAEEVYAVAMERWATGNVMREIKRVQKRKERIEKKVKSMRVLPETPDGSN